MSAHFQRGQLLLGRNRYDQAEKEFRLTLSKDPEDSLALALLAVALLGQQKVTEAEQVARDAVRAKPDSDFTLYVLAGVLSEQDKQDQALEVIDQALAIDPEDADYWERRARILIQKDDWQEALLAINHGLELDPENGDCMNIRSLCLQQMGRTAEATEAADAALRDDPESDLAHANRGWIYLRRGNHSEAEQHFREALRINPDLEYARNGVVTALKSRNMIFRWLLKYFFWMGQLSSTMRWVVVIAIIAGRRILMRIADLSPEVKPFAMTGAYLLLAFILLTWVANPIFNFLLMLHPFGRLALTRRERTSACIVSALLAAGFAGVGLMALTGDLEWGLIAAGAVAYMIPVSGAFEVDNHHRVKLMWFAGGIGAVGLGATISWVAGSPATMGLGVLYVLSVVSFTWIASFLNSRD